jgi:hypothetical protein
MRLPRTTKVIIGCPIWAFVGVVSCATEATGVDSCRKIEYARCDAAAHCPSAFGTIDPAACRRFYRDHCLHGLPTQDPGLANVNLCVKHISDLGQCAAHESEADASLATCSLEGLSRDPEVTTACGLLSQPEKIYSCSFLNPVAADAGD